MIVDKLKLIFIHIPKCGGSSATFYFKDLLRGVVKQEPDWNWGINTHNEVNGETWKHKTIHFFKENYPKEYKEYRKIVFIREPTMRLISYYCWIHKGKMFLERDFLNWIYTFKPKSMASFIDDTCELTTIELFNEDCMPHLNYNDRDRVVLISNPTLKILERLYAEDYRLFKLINKIDLKIY
tara:strand:- start:45 stop:590 length:546 start_codon:yes stop_codon:yes gene_type:complete